MPPRTDWQETIAADEQTRFAEYGRLIGSIQERKARRRSVERTLHAKPHLGARARFTVLPDLPAPCRAGIFAGPGEYDAWVRFSNGDPSRRADHVPDVRGFAVKVLGVPGAKLIPGLASARTQDFLMIQLASFGFKNADDFMFLVRAAQQPALLLPRLIGRFGLGGAFGIIKRSRASIARRISSLAEERFYSPVPVRWGDYAAKFGVLPRAPRLAAPPSKSPDYLREELTARLAAGPIEFDFAVQLYTDAAKTPIEDASVVWPESESPFLPVARITIPQQDLASPAGQKQQDYVEGLSFDPWHAPVEFRPLGDVMRARNETYRVSSMGRQATPEPEEMARFE